MQKIEDALADIANKSCITFRRRDKDDEHAVLIQVNIFIFYGFRDEEISYWTTFSSLFQLSTVEYKSPRGLPGP